MDLEGVWREARGRYGEDVAQQTVLRLLERRGKAPIEDEERYFWFSAAKNRRYTDMQSPGGTTLRWLREHGDPTNARGASYRIDEQIDIRDTIRHLPAPVLLGCLAHDVAGERPTGCKRGHVYGAQAGWRTSKQGRVWRFCRQCQTQRQREKRAVRT